MPRVEEDDEALTQEEEQLIQKYALIRQKVR